MEEPRILAEFITDSNGAPESLQGKSRKHYRMRLFMQGLAKDTSRVTYKLDDTYLEPVRYVPMGVPRFEEEITAYSTYPVMAMVNRGERVEVVTRDLAAALEEAHGSAATPPVRSAIDEIRGQ